MRSNRELDQALAALESRVNALEAKPVGLVTSSMPREASDEPGWKELRGQAGANPNMRMALESQPATPGPNEPVAQAQEVYYGNQPEERADTR